MKASDAKKLRQLRDENHRLKRMVADPAFQTEMLEDSTPSHSSTSSPSMSAPPSSGSA